MSSSLGGPGRFHLFIQVPTGDDLDGAISRVAEATGMLAFDVRQRFLRGGINRLRSGMDGPLLEEAARSLASHGFNTCVVSDAEFDALPRPVRAVELRQEEGAIGLLDAQGNEILRLGKDEDVLVVVGNVDPATAAATPPGSATFTERMLKSGQGVPVLLAWRRGEPRGAVVFGQRFNYLSMGEAAGPASAINFRTLIRLLEGAAREAHIDSSFGRSDIPDLNLRWTDVNEDLVHRLSAHAAVSRAFWERGQGRRQESAPAPVAAPSEPEPLPAEVFDADRVSTPYRRLLASLRRVGPLPVVAPLALGAVIAGGVGLVLPVSILVPPAGIAVALILLLWSRSCWSRKRDIEDHPTSRIRSLAMGPVEIEGRAQACMPLRTPYSQIPCIWYQACIKHLVEVERGKKQWRVTQSMGSGEYPFYVEDGTGKVLVDPAGAVFEVDHEQTFSVPPSLLARGYKSLPMDNETRYIERYVCVGAPIFVFGTARPRRSVERGDGLVGRLRDLKRDPARMKTFDANGDGRIDSDEWEEAVRATEQGLLQDKLGDKHEKEELITVGRGEPGSLFLISDHDQDHVLRSLALSFWGAGLTGLGLMAGSILELIWMLNR